MILSHKERKKKQFNALMRVRSWPGNLMIAKRAVKEAQSAYPISELQWHNIRLVFSPDAFEELKIAAATIATQ